MKLVCLMLLAALPACADPVPIASIQGDALTSTVEGRSVTTEGVVTLTLHDGFWIQQGTPAADQIRSAGLWVFSGRAVGVVRGDRVRVTGRVEEYRPDDRTHDIPVTRLVDPVDIRVLEPGLELPEPVRIGPDGRLPPSTLAPPVPRGKLAPSANALHFWEALEGVRVVIESAEVVGPTSRHGETWVVVDSETPRTPEGAAVVSEGDFNARRALVATNPLLGGDFPRPMNVGDRLSRVTGVVHYAYGNYRIIPQHALDFESGGLEPDVSVLEGGADHLLVAAYNVENLDPHVENLARSGGPRDVDDDIGSGRMLRLAEHVVHRLNAPDIVALQEIQDNDGAEQTSVIEADMTLKEFAAMIRAAGGPDYAFVDRPPASSGADGGQPGGNIRNAFLYRPGRVEIVEDSIRRLDDGAGFTDTRKPLSARFRFNGHVLRLINVHLSSKWGSSPLFGLEQPIIDGGAAGRRAQAEYLAGEVSGEEPALVLGDFNDYYFSPPLKHLTASGLVNLHDTLPDNRRYTYIYQGNAQTLDHILATPGLAEKAEFEVVHVNTPFARQSADHDPLLARFHLPEAAPDGGDMP